MSDDRFKQARRSLMNQPQVPQYEESEDATAMVDLSTLQAGGPQFQPPPNYGGSDEGATQLVDLNALQAGPPAGYGAAPATPSFGGAPPMPSFGATPADQSGGVVIGDGGGVADYEASTQFVDLNALQAGAGAPPMAAAPPPVADYGASAGGGGQAFEGSTQFLDINALAQGQFQGPQLQASDLQPVEQDQALHNDFSYGPESIQRYGDITLIFATNKQGKEVVLKRVWEGSPHTLPDELLSRIQLLQGIKHPKLAGMYGMLMANSGCWVELQRPVGVRLTHVLQQGVKDERTVAKWMKQVAEGIKVVHNHSILYGALTTDAIWLDEATGKIMLEPFDVLVFENRGNLGVFGAPEMNMPPNQRPVTPATDVYSFAAVTLAALTGQVSPQALESLKNAKLKAALGAALSPDPTTRATIPEPIVQALGGGGGLDKRVLIPVVALMVVLLLVVVMMSGGGGEQNANQPTLPAEATQPLDPMALQPRPVAPGEIQIDERLKIETSYQLNPLPQSADEEEQKANVEPSEDDIRRANERVEQGYAQLEAGNKSDPQARPAYHKKAFQALTEAVRIKGKMGSKEEELWKTLMADEGARRSLASAIDEVETALKKDGMTSAQMNYRVLTRMHPKATAGKFFEKNNQAKAILVK